MSLLRDLSCFLERESFSAAQFSLFGRLNGALRHQKPLYTTTWATRTGLSELMPDQGEAWQDYAPWTRRVQKQFARDSAAAMVRATGGSLTERPADPRPSPFDAGAGEPG